MGSGDKDAQELKEHAFFQVESNESYYLEEARDLFRL